MVFIASSKDSGPLPGSSWRVSRETNGTESQRGSSYTFLCGELAEEGLRSFKRRKICNEDPGEEPMRTTTDRLDRAALDEELQDPEEKSPEKTATSSKVRVSTRRTNKYPGEADPAHETRFGATLPRSGKYPKKTLRKSGTSSGKYSRKNRRKSGVEENSANYSVLKSASYWPGNISEEKEKIRGAVPLNSKSKNRKDLRKTCSSSKRGGNWSRRAWQKIQYVWPQGLGMRPIWPIYLSSYFHRRKPERSRWKRTRCRKRRKNLKLLKKYMINLRTIQWNLQEIQSAIWRIQTEESEGSGPKRLPRRVRRGSSILSMIEKPKDSEVHDRRVRAVSAFLSNKPKRDKSKKKLKNSRGLV